MTTNYLTPITESARRLICAHHLAACSYITGQVDVDWPAYRLHSLRMEEIARASPGAFVSLDQAEFELLGEQVPA